MLIYKPEWWRLSTFVPNKKFPVYNWFYFKEGFSRDLVFKTMKMFDVKGVVLDPFCGVGTTLLACKEMGLNSIGFDVLPICVFASMVKTMDYNIKRLKEVSDMIFKERFEKAEISFPERFRRFFNPHTLDDVLFFFERVKGIEEENVRGFFLLGLISSAMKCSYVYKDGGVLKVRKHPVPPFRKFYKWFIKKMIREYKRLEGNGKASVDFGDARNLKLPENSVDVVVTSPPYLNNIDYIKVYAIENWFLGKPDVPIRSYLGLSNEDVVAKYFEDMETFLKRLYQICNESAKLGFVVGNAYVNEKVVEVDKRICEIMEKIGFVTDNIYVLNKRFATKRRTIKVGELRESLVVAEK